MVILTFAGTSARSHLVKTATSRELSMSRFSANLKIDCVARSSVASPTSLEQ